MPMIPINGLNAIDLFSVQRASRWYLTQQGMQSHYPDYRHATPGSEDYNLRWATQLPVMQGWGDFKSRDSVWLTASVGIGLSSQNGLGANAQ